MNYQNIIESLYQPVALYVWILVLALCVFNMIVCIYLAYFYDKLKKELEFYVWLSSFPSTDETLKKINEMDLSVTDRESSENEDVEYEQ